MTSTSLRAVWVSAFAAAMIWAACGPTSAQDGAASAPGLFDQLFGRDRAARDQSQTRVAQVSPSDLLVRIDRLEAHIRQLTGAFEQLQFRNQQIEQQLRRMQEENEFRFQEMGGKDGSRPSAVQQARPTPPAQPVQPAAPAQPGRRSDLAEPPTASTGPGPAGRRSDVFDPALHPSAPGVPRPLGTIPGGPGPIMAEPDDRRPVAGNAPVGAPGGRDLGAPLDLSTLASAAANDPSLLPPAGSPPSAGGLLPAPPPRNPNATGAQTAAVLPPSQSPKGYYDLAYGYVLRKDYALAEDGFREFLRRYPSDRLAPDAHYWLGESMFQRQRYRDAAEAFLAVSTQHETTAKAPDALFRLGQSLAALGEKDAACASLGEVLRKYPRASLSVKQGVEREQKRVRC